jgi:hypothetical protein
MMHDSEGWFYLEMERLEIDGELDRIEERHIHQED